MASLVKDERLNPASGKREPYYRIKYRQDGRQKTEALGFVLARQAAKLLALWEAERLGAVAGAPPTRAPASKVTLAGLGGDRLVAWMRAQGRAAKTVISAQTSWRHLERLLGDVAVAELGQADADRYVAARREEGAKGRTIQIELMHLVQLVQIACDDGLREEPLVVKKPGTQDSRAAVWLTADQAQRLLAALPWSADPVSCLAVYAALELGLRPGELLSRRWEDVRWDQAQHGAIWVGPRLDDEGLPTWQTKTRRNRTLPLTPGLRAALAQWWMAHGRPGEGWLLPSPRDTSKPLGTFRGTLKAACRLAQVPLLHPHALRHCWATRMAQAGIPRVVTQALGGWTSPVVLEKVYEHATSDLEGDALSRASLGGVSDRRILTLARARR